MALERASGAGVVARESRSPTPALLLGLIVTLGAVVGVSWYVTRQTVRPARAADRPHRSQSHRLAAVAPRPERSQLARPRHARHAGYRGAVSADRVESAVRAHSRRSRERAGARGAGRDGAADAGAEPVSRDVAHAVLGCRRSNLRAGRERARDGSPRANPAVAAGAAGRARAPPSRVCWSRTTRAKNRPPCASATSTSQVQRQVYVFLAATFVVIALTSLYLIRANRQLFARLSALSNDRRELAQQLIATRESDASRDLPRAA